MIGIQYTEAAIQDGMFNRMFNLYASIQSLYCQAFLEEVSFKDASLTIVRQVH